jgi:Family of unknown function (DUF5856)
MIEQLISRVFATRNAAHLTHWRTKSYAQHVALNEFYDAVLEALDALVEAHQASALVGEVPSTTVKADGTASMMIKRLEEDLVWFDKNRAAVTQGVQALDNLLQDMEGVYLKAIYKLRHLS